MVNCNNSINPVAQVISVKPKRSITGRLITPASLLAMNDELMKPLTTGPNK